MPNWSDRKINAIGDKTGWVCFYCGTGLTRETIQVDHFIPRHLSKSHDISNLYPCCRSCNSKKGNRSIAHFREIMSRRRDYVKYSKEQKLHLFKLFGIDIDLYTHNEPYQFWYELNGYKE